MDFKKILEKFGESYKDFRTKLRTQIKKTDQQIDSVAKKHEEPRRPMKYPYTFSAKLAQFPLGFYRKNNWIYRYYVYAALACIPVFMYCSKRANTKANKELWREIHRKEAQEHHHH